MDRTRLAEIGVQFSSSERCGREQRLAADKGPAAVLPEYFAHDGSHFPTLCGRQQAIDGHDQARHARELMGSVGAMTLA